MTDDRPMPEYGEYATPEQQAAAMGRVYVSPAEAAAKEQAAREAMAQVTVAQPTSYANRFLTIFLLGLGALTLIDEIPAYFNYASVVRTGFSSGEFSSLTIPSSLNGAGIPTLIAHVVLYLATAVVSVLLLRRGKVSFYVPIVGTVLFGIVAVVLLSIYAPDLLPQMVALAKKLSG